MEQIITLYGLFGTVFYFKKVLHSRIQIEQDY